MEIAFFAILLNYLTGINVRFPIMVLHQNGRVVKSVHEMHDLDKPCNLMLLRFCRLIWVFVVYICVKHLSARGTKISKAYSLYYSAYLKLSTYLPDDKAISFSAINKLSPSTKANDKLTQPARDKTYIVYP